MRDAVVKLNVVRNKYKLCQHVLDPNFDAAFFEKSGSAGVGVVYRDHTGQIIGALRQNIGSVQSIKMAEALAARRAVLFAKELSLFRVIIEGDCTRVIDALKGSGLCRTLNGQGKKKVFCAYGHRPCSLQGKKKNCLRNTYGPRNNGAY
ncbi:hypothetical protein CFP56_022865 [Quercus suber]|uniref:RNase H type-1 domain-containing protein n=1 Tax=Quercus suber TaxID=58331 RepID=A0AAW0KC35_QUESU